MKQKGFTIMELTIAILAVLIISMFLLFPFEASLDKAHDTARNSNVSLMANIIKLDQISSDKKYSIGRNEVLGIFHENSIPLSVIKSDNHYFYGYSIKTEDFFVVVCSESRENFFMAGTPGGKNDLAIIYPAEACQNGTIPVGERYVPIKNSRKSIDSYLVYRII